VAGFVWAYFMRKKPRILALFGIVWIVGGSAWMFMGSPVGLGIFLMGVINLGWGGSNLLKSRQDPLEPDS